MWWVYMLGTCFGEFIKHQHLLEIGVFFIENFVTLSINNKYWKVIIHLKVQLIKCISTLSRHHFPTRLSTQISIPWGTFKSLLSISSIKFPSISAFPKHNLHHLRKYFSHCVNFWWRRQKNYNSPQPSLD